MSCEIQRLKLYKSYSNNNGTYRYVITDKGIQKQVFFKFFDSEDETTCYTAWYFVDLEPADIAGLVKQGNDNDEEDDSDDDEAD